MNTSRFLLVLAGVSAFASSLFAGTRSFASARALISPQMPAAVDLRIVGSNVVITSPSFVIDLPRSENLRNPINAAPGSYPVELFVDYQYFGGGASYQEMDYDNDGYRIWNTVTVATWEAKDGWTEESARRAFEVLKADDNTLEFSWGRQTAYAKTRLVLSGVSGGQYSDGSAYFVNSGAITLPAHPGGFYRASIYVSYQDDTRGGNTTNYWFSFPYGSLSVPVPTPPPLVTATFAPNTPSANAMASVPQLELGQPVTFSITGANFSRVDLTGPDITQANLGSSYSYTPTLPGRHTYTFNVTGNGVVSWTARNFDALVLNGPSGAGDVTSITVDNGAGDFLGSREVTAPGNYSVTATNASGTVTSNNTPASFTSTSASVALNVFRRVYSVGAWQDHSEWAPATSTEWDDRSLTQTRTFRRRITDYKEYGPGDTFDDVSHWENSSESRVVSGTRPLNNRHVYNVGPWQDFTAWTPDASTVTFGQPLTQTRNKRRWITDYWENDRVGRYNDTSRWDPGQDTQTVTGTANRYPTATITADRARAHVGETVTLTITASDPDGNFDYACLLISNRSGWHVIMPNGSFTDTDSPFPGAALWTSPGTHTKTYTFTLDELDWGAEFYATATDKAGLISWSDAAYVDINNRPPTASLTASNSSVTLGGSVTITATASDPDGDLLSNQIDYLAPGTSSWVSGVAPSSRWSGAGTASSTLSPLYSLNTVGVWQFRSQASDSASQTSPYSTATITVVPPPPPTATLIASPSAGIAPLSTTLTWTTTDATAVTVSGPSLSSTQLNGSQSVTLGAGTHTFNLAASGSGGSTTATATVTVNVPTYTLTITSIGNGSATGGGTYSENTGVTASATATATSRFVGWSGDSNLPVGDARLASPSILVVMNRDRTLQASFIDKLAQAITFNPVPPVPLAQRTVNLSAIATSGLPVSYTVLSGPGQVSGNILTLSGVGVINVRATQAGDSTYLPASPVDRSITVIAPGVIEVSPQEPATNVTTQDDTAPKNISIRR